MSVDVLSIKREERQWQDLQGGSLQQRAYERPGTQIVMQQQFLRVAGALNIKPGMRLLDLGCGAGLFLSWLIKTTKANCFGVDLSLTSAQSARELSSKLKLAVGDAEILPYKSNSFERISCNGAAHHLLDLHSALSEIHRILMPGGIVVMYEPTSTKLTNAIRHMFFGFDRYESPADLAHKGEFTPHSIKATLIKVGFTGIVTSQHDCLAYPLTGMYMNLPFSRFKRFMKFMTAVEDALRRLPLFKPVMDLFSWRLLIVAVKPSM